MAPEFIHKMNPVITNLCGIELYYYGLAYSVGFVGIYLWLRQNRKPLGWNKSDVYDFSILFSAGVLLAARLFSVFVYHRQYYSDHLNEIFHYWQGGMATHGVLLGAVLSIFIYARWRKISFRRLADEIVIPAAFLLALGRIGNFINGQICGTVTSVWWAVKFPGVEGFRHPVTLYEAAKNLMIVPILLSVRFKYRAGKGLVAAHFIFWYGFLRLFTDIFRDHGAQWLGIGVNQYYNMLMVAAGLICMYVFPRLDRWGSSSAVKKIGMHGNIGEIQPNASVLGLWIRRFVLVMIILFSLVIRSAWTPQVLERRRTVNTSHCFETGYAETEPSTLK